MLDITIRKHAQKDTISHESPYKITGGKEEPNVVFMLKL